MKSCQDVSLAGKRAGMAGARSGLFYEFLRIVEEMREATSGRYPAVAVFENVYGLLSSNRGRDFAAVLAGLRNSGAAVAFRVLDAQFHGVPQRRRRVFIVADFAPVGVGERRAAHVLALGESLCGHPAAGGESGQGSAAAAESGAGVGGEPLGYHENLRDVYPYSIAPCIPTSGLSPSRPGGMILLEPAVIGTITANYGNQNGQDAYANIVAEPVAAEGGNRTSGPIDVAACLSTSNQRLDFETQTLIVSSDVASSITASAGHHGHSSPRGDGSDNLVAEAQAFDWQAGGGNDTSFRGKSRQYITRAGDYVGSLGTTKQDAVAITFEQRIGRNGRGVPSEVVNALKDEAGRTGKGDAAPCVAQSDGLCWIVRRLTPTEGERCMGYQDDWTRWRADGSEISDSARWRMIGNGVASPVAEWIAKRLHAALEASA